MKAVQVGIFSDHELGGCHVFKSGLEKNGYEVIPFDYRLKGAASSFEAMNRELLDCVRGADLLFIGKGESVFSSTLRAIKAQDIPICLWYGDIRPQPEPWLIENLRYIDAFFMSSGGEILKRHVQHGKPGIGAYYFNPSFPDFVETLPPPPQKAIEILFTGSAYGFASEPRVETIKYLAKRRDTVIVGGAKELAMRRWQVRLMRHLFGKPRPVRGREYYDLIRKSKIGIGINAYADIPKYTSDRMTHYMELGSFFLCRYFPGIEQLFRIGEELDVFHSTEELAIKLRTYLYDEQARESIAKRGSARIFRDYNAEKIVAMMLEILQTGHSSAYEWVETYRK